MLRDLEELVLSIKKENIKEYMKEAMNCYNVGSYRASIILSTIAGMHDLREKVQILSTSINEIRIMHNRIEELANAGDNFENYMIEQATSNGILSTAETDSIKSYKALRNRCAHPNEYLATAEEARMVFSGYFDNVINKPSLLGPAYIKVIIDRLKNETFFPETTYDNVSIIVMEEIGRLHQGTILPLANKLISVLEDDSEVQSIQWKNATMFLAVLLREIKDEQIIKSISEKLGRLIEHEKLVVSILVSSRLFPRLITFLNPTDKQRFLAYLKTSIHSEMPDNKIKVIHSLFTEGTLSETEKNDILGIFTEKIEKSIKIIFDSTDRSSVDDLSKWSGKVKEMNILQIDNKFFNTLIRLIEDNDYSVVNHAITMLNELEKDLLNRMNDQQFAELFIAIIKQAHGPGRGADEARKLWNGDFSKYREDFVRFIELITTDYSKYKDFIEKLIPGEQYLIEIIDKLNNHILFENVITLLNEEFKDNPDELEIELSYFSRIIKRVEKTEWDGIVSELDSILQKVQIEKETV